MRIESDLNLSPRVQSALEELAAIIRQHYPEATFRVSRGEDDPAIVQLVMTVDLEDTDPVFDVIMPRLLELHDEDLPIFVAIERPPERTLAIRQATRAQGRATIPATPG